MKFIPILLLCCSILTNIGLAGEDTVNASEIDFVHYLAELEPNFREKSLQGMVAISFVPAVQNLSEITFSAQNKKIASVKLNGMTVHHSVSNERLAITFESALETGQTYTLEIEYSAAPKQGLKFYDDHLFTVYHTKNWLVSHDDISDKATFELLLTHDANLATAGNGKLVSLKAIGQDKTVSHWRQDTPMPLYTFGFAVGNFETRTLKTQSADFSVLYRDGKTSTSGLTAQMIDEAFVDVADMLSFFESKAGSTLGQNDYRYVVVDGYMAQEASGFSLVGEKFVHTVLENKNENWFIAHELAHEWWGNSVTSANFSHFWLNEGLAVFMVAAYKQHLFGDTAYKNEIKVAARRVERAVKENRTGPVAFRKVITEQDLNRTMVYSKGAIVFYMLREKLGDALFWKALKHYTQAFENKSVTTQDLKKSFEKTTGEDLTDFFNKWVYGHDIPHLIF